jgi:hypothetical protein
MLVHSRACIKCMVLVSSNKTAHRLCFGVPAVQPISLTFLFDITFHYVFLCQESSVRAPITATQNWYT